MTGRRCGRDGRIALGVVLAMANLAACSDAPTAVPAPGAIDLARPWVEAEPAKVGMDGEVLETAADAAGAIDRLRSLLVVRHGRLVLERYYHGWAADSLTDVRSVTKSVVSTLVGLALDDGHLESLDQPITDYLRAPEAPVRAEHAAISIRDLLTMTGGFDWEEEATNIYADWVGSDDQVAFVLNRPLESTPGTPSSTTPALSICWV